MISLTLQSSKSCVSAAIFQDSKILSFKKLRKKKKETTENLMMVLEKLHKDFPINKINQIILPRGPGSFTGIRSLISVAQGLALGCNAKIRTVSTFEAIISSENFSEKKCLVIFKDSRDEYLFQFFKKKSNTILPKKEINSGDSREIKNHIEKVCLNEKIAIISDQNYRMFYNTFFKLHNLKVIEYDAKNVFFAHQRGFSSRSINPIYYFKHYAE